MAREDLSECPACGVSEEHMVGSYYCLGRLHREGPGLADRLAALRARAERAEEAVREAQKLTCAASAPGVPSPTKGSDAGGDGDGSRQRCVYCERSMPTAEMAFFLAAWLCLDGNACHAAAKQAPAAPRSSPSSATGPGGDSRCAKPSPADPADVVAAFFAEKEGR